MTRAFLAIAAGVLIASPNVSFGQVELRGEVTDLTSERLLRGVRVEVLAVEERPPTSQIFVFSDSSGSYVIHDVPTGTRRVRATYRNGSYEYTLKTPPVEMDAGVVRIDFEFDRSVLGYPAGGMRIIARREREDGLMRVGGTTVDGNSGERLPNATIEIGSPASDAGAGRLVTVDTTTSDDEGRFAFAERAPGQYALRFSKRGYFTLTSEPEYMEGTIAVILRLSPSSPDDSAPVSAAGRILDGAGRRLLPVTAHRRAMREGVLFGRVRFDGRVVPGAAIEILDAQVGPATASPQGYFEIPGVAPGTYSMRVTAEGRTTVIRGVVVSVGGNELVLDL